MQHLSSTTGRVLALALTLLSALVVASPSHAQATATTRGEATAATEIKDVGNPVINLPGANPYQRSDFHTNQAASAGTVFVNPPAPGTCVLPGDGASLQFAQVGAVVSKGGKVYVRCDIKDDALNMKVTGQPPEVIKARYCMDEAFAEAYARAGLPCEDKRPPAPQQQAAKAGEPTDPYTRMRLNLPPL